MSEKIVSVLWTGGWDSTYRIIELSKMNVTVQPYYLYGDGRNSEKYERKAMSNILEMIKKKESTRATIKPIEFIDINKLPKDEEISTAYHNLRKETKIGSQYEWLAVFAKNLDNGLELGIEKVPSNKMIGCSATIRKFGKLEVTNDISNYRIDCNNSSKDCVVLLKNFRFPIIDVSEKEMLSNIKQWNDEDVMAHIWFCHSPIKGEPCGFCNPCAEKMQSGMEFLLPAKAQKNYKCEMRLQRLIGKRGANKLVGIYRKVFLK